MHVCIRVCIFLYLQDLYMHVHEVKITNRHDSPWNTHTHTHIHTHTHSLSLARIHAQAHAHTCARARTHTHTHKHARTHTFIRLMLTYGAWERLRFQAETCSMRKKSWTWVCDYVHVYACMILLQCQCTWRPSLCILGFLSFPFLISNKSCFMVVVCACAGACGFALLAHNHWYVACAFIHDEVYLRCERRHSSAT
jgi:hypothetical protein